MPSQFENVTALAKANVYFDGKVVSHTITAADGTRRTLGLIFAGEYHFQTRAPEQMDLVAGACRVRLDGQEEWHSYGAGEGFAVRADAGFTIVVDAGIAEYVCTFG